MSDYKKSTHLLLGEKRVEVRVACSHISSPNQDASPLAHDANQLEWCVLACMIEKGRRPFEVVATGVSKGVPDEEVAIRLALLNLSEKVSWQDQELVAQALVQLTDSVGRHLFSLREIFFRKPKEIAEVTALLRGNLPTDEPT